MKSTHKLLMFSAMIIVALAFTGVVLDAEESDATSVISISVGTGQGTINLYDSNDNLLATSSSSTPATYTMSSSAKFKFVAVADSGYEFSSWTASWSVTNTNPFTVILSDNGNAKTMVANFSESSAHPTTKVTVYVNQGVGSISVTDGYTTLSSSSSATDVGYLRQGTLTITCTPGTNYTISGTYRQSEGSSVATGLSGTSPYTSTLSTTNTIYYVNFTYTPPAPTNPSIDLTSRTGGSVTLSIDGGSTLGTVSSNDSNHFNLTANTTYRLTASPSPGYYFTGFTTGSYQTPSGGSDSITFTATGTTTYYYYANWSTTVPTYTFRMNVQDGGSVTLSVGGQADVVITGGNNNEITVARGTVVTATPTATTGFTFKEWYNISASYMNDNPLVYTVNKNENITAKWNSTPTLSFYLRVDLGGYATATFNGATYTVQGGTSDHWTLDQGTSITLNAYADTGNQFYAWVCSVNGSPDYSHTSTPYTFTLTNSGQD